MMSSWTSVKAWKTSAARPAGTTSSGRAPKASAASTTTAGRSRFPLASSTYRTGA